MAEKDSGTILYRCRDCGVVARKVGSHVYVGHRETCRIWLRIQILWPGLADQLIRQHAINKEKRVR